jgi:hypothetical protein
MPWRCFREFMVIVFLYLVSPGKKKLKHFYTLHSTKGLLQFGRQTLIRDE